jgi:hypothetical protein
VFDPQKRQYFCFAYLLLLTCFRVNVSSMDCEVHRFRFAAAIVACLRRVARLVI